MRCYKCGKQLLFGNECDPECSPHQTVNHHTLFSGSARMVDWNKIVTPDDAMVFVQALMDLGITITIEPGNPLFQILKKYLKDN